MAPIDLRRRRLDIPHFSHVGMTKMETEAKIFWWSTKKSDIETKLRDCTACFASGKNLKHQLPSKHYGKLEKLTEPGQEIQLDFIGKIHNQKLNGDVQILIAVDRFSKCPIVETCETAEPKEVINFLTSNFNLYGKPEKKSNRIKEAPLSQKNTKNFEKTETMKINTVHLEDIW